MTLACGSCFGTNVDMWKDTGGATGLGRYHVRGWRIWLGLGSFGVMDSVSFLLIYLRPFACEV